MDVEIVSDEYIKGLKDEIERLTRELEVIADGAKDVLSGGEDALLFADETEKRARRALKEQTN